MRLLVFFLVFIHMAYATVSGVAFKDYNADGIKQEGEPVVSGVSIKAYDINDAKIAETTTDLDGNYLLDINAPARLEFGLPENSCLAEEGKDFPSASADKYGSDIQFVKTNDEVHNFAISYPYDTSTDENPVTFTSILVHGDPNTEDTSSVSVGEVASIIKFNFNDSGLAENGGRPLEDTSTSTNMTEDEKGPAWIEIVKQRWVGNIYGLAYSRQANKVFASAIVKRSTGLGPLGVGGIYIIDPEASNNTEESVKFVNLDDIGVITSEDSLGGAYDGTVINGDDDDDGNDEVMTTYVVGTNTERGLDINKSVSAYDSAAYGQVGKLGIGDIEISEDGQYLYLVNLYDRKLYQLDLQDPQNPTVPMENDVVSFDIPSDLCTDSKAGEYRPFGLKVKKDNVYVGIVCSGQDQEGNTVADSGADMKGGVYRLDLIEKSWTKEIDWTFDYRDGQFGGANGDDTNKPLDWNPWTNKWLDLENGEAAFHPIPIIKDIEVDNNGDLIIGIADNLADMIGGVEQGLSGGDSGSFYGLISSGDIIKAERITSDDSCSYTIDLSGDEFYQDQVVHAESAGGALAGHHTSYTDSVLSSMEDPVKTIDSEGNEIEKIWAYGVTLFDNRDGSKVVGDSGYEIAFYHLNYEAKSNGIGDLETLEMVPPIEIGNRVWEDTNKNGIQDANEEGIAGVELFLSLGDDCYNEIARTTTDSNGNYLFNEYNVNEESLASGLQEYTQYTICIDKSQLVGDTGVEGTPLEGFRLTNNDINGSSDNPDKTDSDGVMNEDDFVSISFMTNGVGENIHSFDFGFYPLVSLGSLVWFDKNDNGQQDDTESGIGGLKVTLLDENGSEVDGVDPVITNADGEYLFEGFEAGVYKVKLESDTTDLADYLVDSSVQNTYADDDNVSDSNIESGNSTEGYISAPITLEAYKEPTGDAEVAPLSTGTQDDTRDSSGNMTLNLGLYQTYTLGGKVWIDSDKDGIQDADELAKSDIIVKLLDSNGEPVKQADSDEDYTVVTSTDGTYHFQNLKSGDYKVEFVIPDGYLISPKDATDDDVDSDINSNDLTTDTLTLEENILTVDAGIYTPTISGTIYDDGNGDGTVNGTPLSSIDDTLLYVTLLDSDGAVVSSNVVNSDGTYLFDEGVYADTNYIVVLSTSQDSTEATLLSGWTNSDGEHIGADAGLDDDADGRLSVEVQTDNITQANFGINKKPEAYDVIAESQINPNDDNQVVVPDLNVTDNEGGTPTTITIVSLPDNATLYYDGNEILSSQTIENFENSKLTVDPDDGEVTVVFEYSTIDNAGVESESATVTMPFTDLLISGHIFNDGNNNGSVDGTLISSAGDSDLFVTVVDSDGAKVASAKIVDGQFVFSSSDGITPNSNYTLVLTDTLESTTAQLPSNWTNADGEEIGESGLDGSANGEITVAVEEENIIDINFGINERPVAEDQAEAPQTNPGSTTQVVVPTLVVSDREDGTPTTVMITTLPSNATLYYDGELVEENVEIIDVNLSKFTLDPQDGELEAVFEYVAIDVTGAQSESATVTMPFTNLQISGHVFNDGNSDGIVNGEVIYAPDGVQLYVALLNDNGELLASQEVDDLGAYSFDSEDGILADSNYTIVLSTEQDKATPDLPENWTNLDGEHIGTDAGTDGKSDGIIEVPVADVSVIEVNFGINKKPVAGDYTEPEQLNPGGDVQVDVPDLNITDNEDGTPKTVTIETVPTHGVLYYDGEVVSAGEVIDNFDNTLLTLDPDDGDQVVSFTYTTTDSAGVESEVATVTMTFKGLKISGNIFDDGNNNGTVDGTSISLVEGVQLYATLLDGDNKVMATTPISSEGTYAFDGVDGIAPNRTYTVVLSTEANSTTAQLPSNWENADGEHIGVEAGLDDRADGKIAVSVLSEDVVQINFGINQQPVAYDKNETEQLNPGGEIRVVVPTLEITDKEDITPTTVTIKSLPTNGTLYYDGEAVRAGEVIENFDNSKLMVDPIDGNQRITFTYTTTDQSGFESKEATVTVPFVGVMISGNVFDDGNGDGEVNGIKIYQAGETPLFVNLLDSERNLIASYPLSSDNNGSYQFDGNDAVTVNTGYILVLTTEANSTTPSLPEDWNNADGEQIGTDSDLDTRADGEIVVHVGSSDINHVNFGINERPTTENVESSLALNPNTTIQVIDLIPADREDGVPKIVTITTLPTEGTLYYDGIEVVEEQNITDFNNSKLMVQPNSGNTVIVFTYSATDASGWTSVEPSRVRMPFYTPVSTSVPVMDSVVVTPPIEVSVTTTVEQEEEPVSSQTVPQDTVEEVEETTQVEQPAVIYNLDIADDAVEANTEGATTIIDVLDNDAVNDGVVVRLVDLHEGEILWGNGSAVGGTNISTTDVLEVEGEGVWRVENGVITFTAQDNFEGTPQPIYYLVEDTQGNRSNVAEVSIISDCVCEPYEQDLEDSVASLNGFGMVLFMFGISLIVWFFRDEYEMRDVA